MKNLLKAFALTAVIMTMITTPALAENVSVYNCCGAVTADGSPFLPYSQLTNAAFPMYPFGSILEVCMPSGSPCVTTTTTDATPDTSTFDVSWAAGEILGLTDGMGRCNCLVHPLYIPS